MYARPDVTNRVAAPLRNARGAVLPLIAFVVVVILILTLSIFQFAWQDQSLVYAEQCREQALFLAEAGLAVGESWLEAQAPPPGDAGLIYPFGDIPEALATGSYLVSILPDSTTLNSARRVFTVTSIGIVDGRERWLETDVALGPISLFLYLTDTEHEPGSGNPLWFCTYDVIDGPLFTNDQISIFGDPQFLDFVGSAYGGPNDGNQNHDASFLYYNGDDHNHIESTLGQNAPFDNPLFAEGFQLGCNEIEYPTHPAIVDLKGMAMDGGIFKSGNYEVMFGRPDEVTGEPMYGYVSYRKNEEWTDVEISSLEEPVLYVNGSISVSGVLDGVMTVVSSGSMYIIDDVVYRDSGPDGPSPDCDDLLGLVAGTDLNISNTVPNQSDCVVHAAAISINNCFRVENWATGDPRGYLTFYGSMAQDFRGPVGTGYWDGQQFVVQTGYMKDYHYDPRLFEIAPPGFIEFFQGGFATRLNWREVTPSLPA
jgi:hypothetical protein